MKCLFGTARYWETCQEQAYSVDGSKLKTPHLVRGVHVCKENNYALYDFVLMEDLEYAALLGLSTIRPFEVGRKGGMNSRPSMPSIKAEIPTAGKQFPERGATQPWTPS